MKSDERKKSRSRNALMAVLFVIFAAVFVFSLVQLVLILRDYNEGVEIYSDMRESYMGSNSLMPRPKNVEKEAAQQKENQEETAAAEPTAPAGNPDYSEYEHEEKLMFLQTSFNYILVPLYVPDFTELIVMNPEVKGWITIEGTHIDYPFVQGEDNEKYVRITLTGKKNNAGTIFIDYHISYPFEDRNTIIHGHNQRNGHMFHDLVNYKDPEYLKEHPYVKIFLPDGRMLLYRIYSAYEMTDTRTYQYGFSTDESYAQYLDFTVQSSLYPTGIVPQTWDRVLTLSTCTNTYNDSRFVIHAYLVEAQ